MPSTPLHTWRGCSTDSAPPSPLYRLRTIPSTQVVPPPTPGLHAPSHPHTLRPFARLMGAQHRQCATLPSFPFTDNPLCPGCAPPPPPCAAPPPPPPPPPPFVPPGGGR